MQILKHASTISFMFIAAMLQSVTAFAAATNLTAPSMAVPTGLSLLEIKITGDEYVMIQNNTASAITDLSAYWLTVFNNTSPLAAGVSSSSQQLPAAGLQPHQTLLLSASPMQTCGASVAGKLSLSLTDGGGFLELTKAGLNQDGSLTQITGDFVSWNSSASGIVQNVPSSTKDPRAAYYRYLTGTSYSWQLADVDANNGCQLNFVVTGGAGSSSAVTPLTLATTSPPATILGITGDAASGDTTSSASLPASDVGLLAPQLSELLPNPVGTGNDATDEFIELYNPNTKPFDLTGFTLQTGIKTTHSYTFPAGSTLAPQSFHAFYSKDTKLTLSNTTSEVVVLDPFNNVIADSGVYSKAKDGTAWALANGQWYWTTQVTPNAANVIRQPPAKKSTTKKKATKKIGHAVSGTSKAGKKKLLTTPASSTNFDDDKGPASTIHVWVLAAVAGVALLYGAYEYRRDITNRLYRLKSKFGPGRAARASAGGRRDD